jgi:DNA-binding NtrC family response regulator
MRFMADVGFGYKPVFPVVDSRVTMEIVNMGAHKGPLKEVADDAIKALLYRELSAMNGQVGRVAQRLQTNRTYVYALCKKYGIHFEHQRTTRVVLASPDKPPKKDG